MVSPKNANCKEFTVLIHAFIAMFELLSKNDLESGDPRNKISADAMENLKRAKEGLPKVSDDSIQIKQETLQLGQSQLVGTFAHLKAWEQLQEGNALGAIKTLAVEDKGAKVHPSCSFKKDQEIKADSFISKC